MISFIVKEDYEKGLKLDIGYRFKSITLNP